MKYKDICTKRVWEQNGGEKTKWLKVGTMRVTDSGSEFIELNILPDTPLFVFEQKDKNEQPQSQPTQDQEPF